MAQQLTDDTIKLTNKKVNDSKERNEKFSNLFSRKPKQATSTEPVPEATSTEQPVSERQATSTEQPVSKPEATSTEQHVSPTTTDGRRR